MESNRGWLPIGRYGEASGLSAQARGPLRGPKMLRAPTTAFGVVLLYCVLEYGRPQDAMPLLAPLRLSLLTSGLLALLVAKYAGSVQWFRPQTLLLTLVLGMMYAWIPLATNNYWALKTTLVLTQTYLFVVGVATFVDTPRRLRVFALVWVAAGLFQAVFGIAHGGTGTGYFQADENDFALTMCMILPFAVLTAGAMPARWMRALSWVTAVICCVAIVASDSRGGFVGLVTTAGAMVCMHRYRVRMLLAGTVAAGAFFVAAPQAYWDEMATIFEEGGTREDRTFLWGIAMRVYEAHPVFGVGPSNINWVLNDYQDYDPEKRMMGGRAVHSLYVTLLAEMGTAGALLFLLILVYNARDILSVIRSERDRDGPRSDPYARAIACSISAYLVCGVFLSVLWYPHLFLLTGLVVAIRSLTEARAPMPTAEPAGPPPEGALEGAG